MHALGYLLLELAAAGANSDFVISCIADSSRLEQLTLAWRKLRQYKVATGSSSSTLLL
jgi:hypothetical protein